MKQPGAKRTKKESAAPLLGARADQRFSWRKLSSAKWSDSWFERLAHLGPQRVMLVEFPGARTVRVEAHGLTAKEAGALVKMFGGQFKEAQWLTLAEPAIRPAIRIRQRLLIVSTADEQARALPSPTRGVIYIPAGMAFGTGEHDTTVTCLRLLCDIAGGLEGQRWDALDLGTGSGILAIAARMIGAEKVNAGDFDSHAVRTAKENVALNHVTRVSIRKMDVLKWEPERSWQVVTANLFSGLLIQAAPKLASAVASGGVLIFSGTLRSQEKEVVSALRSQALRVDRIVRKGKWVTGVMNRK